MKINYKLKDIFYGGDYNPEQWDEEVWEEDIRMMRLYKVNAVTLSVFSWAKLQLDENTYDFVWLDKIINKLWENKIYVILATPTAAQPAWMSKKYSSILPVNVEGHKMKHGRRSNFCPNSSVYKGFASKIAEKLAERYKDNEAIILWHVSNEYGTYCYCENCAKEFRIWLKKKYKTIENLNEKWYAHFWGHTFYDFDEIEPPSNLSEILPGALGDRDGTCFQAMAIDYNRFMSDSILSCYDNEAKVLKRITPNIPITTNLMAAFKPLDYFKWAQHMDVVSWDSYPANSDSTSNRAFSHDLMRGVKGQEPFLLMEQTPNQTNWQQFNALKRPGVMRLWSYQAMAHGADSIMFFQWRQSRGACEKYHGGLVPHAGHENTRIGRELKVLGEELHNFGHNIQDSKIDSKVAIMFDWSNWWAVEFSSGPSIALNYVEQIQKYYKAFHDMNISVDIIKPTDDLSKYKIVVAPVLYMVNDEAVKSIEYFTSEGGTFITTFLSGMVDESDLVILGGYPGAFKKLLGIWVEEIDSLYPGVKNEIIKTEDSFIDKDKYECELICDVVNAQGAKVLATFGKEFYAGSPAITENIFGNGKAVYIASSPQQDFIKMLTNHYCETCGITSIIKPQIGVEVSQRKKEEDTFTFVLNHNEDEVRIKISNPENYVDLLGNITVGYEYILEPKGVLILKSK